MGQEHVGQQQVELPLFSLKDIHCLFCIRGLEYDVAVFTKRPGEKFTEFFFLRPLRLGDVLSRFSSLTVAYPLPPSTDRYKACRYFSRRSYRSCRNCRECPHIEHFNNITVFDTCQRLQSSFVISYIKCEGYAPCIEEDGQRGGRITAGHAPSVPTRPYINQPHPRSDPLSQVLSGDSSGVGINMEPGVISRV